MLKDYLSKIKLCAACPKMCRFACPVAEVEKKERVTPWGKSLTALLVLEGRLSYDDPDVVDTFYSCCMCKRCRSYCLVDDVDIPTMIQAGREEIVAAKKEPEEIKQFLKHFKEFNNPFGKNLKSIIGNNPLLHPFNSPLSKGGNRGVEWSEGQLFKSDILYFVGCSTLLDNDILNSTIKILEKTVIQFNIFSDCCGFPLWTLGYTEEAKGLMAKVKDAVLSSGAKKIITSCPACAYMLKTIYPKLGINLQAEILHITQFINTSIKDGGLHLNKKSDIDTAYQDPCFLGRYLYIYDEPRNILSQTSALKETAIIKERSNCCGAGLYHFRQKTAKAITGIAIDNVSQTDPKQIITSCPTCKRIFSEVLRNKISVKDITELI